MLKKTISTHFSFNTKISILPKKFVLLISTKAKFDPYIRIWRFPLVPPSSLYLYFKKILEKGQFPIEKPEKNCNTMTYLPLSWLVTPILNTANNHVMTIFSAQMMSNKVQLYLILRFGKFLMKFNQYFLHLESYFTMLTTNVTKQDRLFLKVPDLHTSSRCWKCISKHVFKSVWLIYNSFSLLSFEITWKQAWFLFSCNQTRHTYFSLKHQFSLNLWLQNIFINYRAMGAKIEMPGRVIDAHISSISC